MLPICREILDRLVFNEIFRFLIEKKLISSKQSGFKLGYSWTFIYNPGNMQVFWWCVWSERCFSWYLKSVYKVWHKGIIFKLKRNGIFGKLLRVLSDFLKDRKHRVTLNGQVSSWTGVNAGVSQRSVVDLLLWFISTI